MNMLRTFIAIRIPGDVRQAIHRNVASLKKAVDKSTVRWVAPDNIHLTLKFLGDVAPSNLDLLKQMLAAEAGRHRCFQMEVGTLGVFPNLRQPRVIWVGLEGSPALSALQRGVEAFTERLGYQPEGRAFSPHLTVGRVQDHVHAEDLNALRTAFEKNQVPPLGCVGVDGLDLMKSDLQPGGSVYTTLFSAPLAPA
jgi:RNA 2',3'-cyclic 3'-phosphodiesterase